MAVLEDPLRLVVGDKAAKPLDRALELRIVGDLLRHYPRRYETRGELTGLASLRDGEYVTVQAEVARVTSRPMRGRWGSIFEATVTDGHGLLVLTFFSRGRQGWRERQLSPGARGLFSGQVSTFRGKRQLAHPDTNCPGSISSSAGKVTCSARPRRARPAAGPAIAGPAARLALLEAGLVGAPGAVAEFAGLVASHRRPQPPYACGPEAAVLGATSMIDISDGLVADLGHVAEASGVRLDIEAARLPDDPALRPAAETLGADRLRWILTGGEDHALAATFPRETDLPGHWLVVGTARKGHGVTVDSRPADRLGGWQHFA